MSPDMSTLALCLRARSELSCLSRSLVLAGGCGGGVCVGIGEGDVGRRRGQVATCTVLYCTAA